MNLPLTRSAEPEGSALLTDGPSSIGRTTRGARTTPRVVVHWTIEPFHIAIPVTIGIVLWRTARPISDIDIFWHSLIGEQIRRTHGFQSLGVSWSLYDDHNTWRTTQWLSEVAISAVRQAGGWDGIVAVRGILGAIFLVGLAAVIVGHRPARASGPIFLASALPAGVFIRDRPELFSAIFLLWLAKVLYEVIAAGRGPNWKIVLIVTAVWANFHGYWITVPLFLGVLAGSRTISGWRRHDIRVDMWGPTLAALAGGCFNPDGVKGIYSVIAFRDAPDWLDEWQRTTLTTNYAFCLFLIVIAVVVAWARSSQKISVDEIAIVTSVFVFALLSARNVGVSAVLIGPLAAYRVARHWPGRSPVGRGEARLLAFVATAACLVALGSTAVAYADLQPLSATQVPHIAEYLATIDKPVRVFNEYNLAGPLLVNGNTNVKLAIDGRFDRFDPDYRTMVITAVTEPARWSQVEERLRPEFAVIGSATPLAHQLTKHYGWRPVLVDGKFSLLAAPSD